MSNLWLDDLSEDWIPPTQESTPSLPPSVSSASHSSVEIRAQPRSRIPRFTASSPAIKKPADAPSFKVLPGKRKGALAQRTQSDNNILNSASTNESDANNATNPPTLHRRSLSTSSIQSGGQSGTVAQKPRDPSPVKGAKIQDTPEWKRRLIQGKMGYGDQKDLFSPMGLENIFQQPNQRSTKKKQHKRGLSMPKDTDMSAMPSSPPPWPTRGSGANSSLMREDAPNDTTSGAMDGIGEDAPAREDQSAHSLGEERVDGSEHQEDDNGADEVPDTDIDDPSFPDSDHDDSDHDMSSATREDMGNRSHITSGTIDEGSSFSPVFVQKHSTRDGRIDYAAIASKSQLERLRNLSLDLEQSEESGLHQSKQQDGTETSSLEKLRSEALPEDLPVGTPDLGDFVNVKRGGLSDEGSFRERPLSPSPLGRKLTNTSHGGSVPASNVDSLSPKTASPKKPPTPESPDGDFDLPLPPKTPARDPGSKFLSPERPVSSGSPLKLFDNHDTFTMKKLQRRMSQIEDDLQHEPPLVGQRSSSRSRSSTGSPSKRNLSVRLPSVEEASFQQAPSPVNAVPAQSQTPMRQVSNSSQFGRGELDEYPFPSDLGFPDFRSSLEDFDHDHSPERDLHGSPSQSPHGELPKFQLNNDDTSVFETTTRTKRKLSKHTMRSWTTTVTRKNSITIPKSPRMDPEAGDSEDFLDSSEGKRARAPPSPFKNPTPKRRRTLVAADVIAVKDVASHAVQETHSVMQDILERKRGDSRLGAFRNSAEPDVLAQRRILRPRNPTPSQRRKEEIQAQILEVTDEFIASSPGLKAVKERLESPASRDHASSGEDDARAVASEVAAFSVKSKQGMKEQSPTIATQDILDQARMVMDYIRSRGRPNSALKSVSESSPESPISSTDHLDVPNKPLSFSRPPSRDGSKGGWRNPGTADVSPRIASHLRRYEEKDEDDFTLSGFHTFEPEQRRNDDLFDLQDAHANGFMDHLRDRQTDATQKPRSRRSTSASRPSTMDSSLGRTQVTNASRRSDNVAVLAPEAVAHLIPNEIAGMSFDPERNAWVKRKSPKRMPPAASTDASAFTGSESDAFRSIPDLNVDANEERNRMSQYPPDLPADSRIPSRFRESFMDTLSMEESERSGGTARPKARDGAEPPAPDSSSVPSKLSNILASSGGPKTETRATSISEKEPNVKARQGPNVPPALHEVPSPSGNGSTSGPDGTKQSRPSEKSASYSPPSHFSNGTKSPNVDDNLGSLNGHLDEDSTVELQRVPSAEDVPSPQSFTTTPPSIRRGPSFFSRATNGRKGGLFSSHLNGNRELSIIECGTPQRQMRFQVSLSRPVRSATQSPAAGSPFVDATFMLSDLPDFTVNQVDERELPDRALVMRNRTTTVQKTEDRFAHGIFELVKAMQDAEPDELFWDDLRRLGVSDKGLPSVHRLDEMCPKLEELDVSNNELAQLTGAPPSIRRLDIHNNYLTGLTSWSHLLNLQYLDISGNAIDSLKGIAPLIHLRELKADDNQIDSLEGVVELDGLLKLSLKGNKLRSVDFEGSYLDRLEELDVSDNELECVRSLGALPALRVLNLDNNDLPAFPTDQASSNPTLRTLTLNHNDLSTLDVHAFPLLTTLHADSNALTSISGIARLAHLHILTARSQTSPPHAPAFNTAAFTANRDIHTLALSANAIPTFAPTAPLLNLHVLELASCGLTTLPPDFGYLAPNLRSVNLNWNALRDLRPLLGMRRLERLSVVENRLQRLRVNLMVLARLKALERVDARGNPWTLGFYAAVGLAGRGDDGQDKIGRVGKAVGLTIAPRRDSIGVDADADAPPSPTAPHTLPPSTTEIDFPHRARLDPDTALRRRVYEILLAQGCRNLRSVDGLPFCGKEVLGMRDGVWERLREVGVLREKGTGKRMDG